MNQFFSFKRFSLLVAKHWADNKKRYTLSVFAFIGLLITWFVFSILTEFDRVPMGRQVQTITFFLSLFMVGTFYASQFFSELGARPKALNFLLVPASAFEKLLCSLLYTVVLFLVVFITSFYAVDMLMVGIAKAITGTVTTGEKIAVANVFDMISVPFNNDTTVNFLFFFLSVQAAFLLGSVYFEKYSFIKTIIGGFIVGFLVFCLTFLFYEELLPSGYHKNGFLTSYLVKVDGANDRLIQVPGWIGRVLQVLVMYGIAPFLWIVTYYRLKEKQV
ncbi:MAG: hypothetical protein EOO14_00585 [Chitinophagaceae bacterium]|nr:MAG: hypothetical protein EOO14_00585 [Chitinophagaceae bacterium]